MSLSDDVPITIWIVQMSGVLIMLSLFLLPVSALLALVFHDFGNTMWYFLEAFGKIGIAAVAGGSFFLAITELWIINPIKDRFFNK